MGEGTEERLKEAIVKILINDIECHAYHGCIDEEGKIGQRFSVDLELDMDFTKALNSDELGDTADYVVLHDLVREEMAIRSKLIEHVAGRIMKRVKAAYPEVKKCKVAVTKYNPPVNGQLGKAVVIIEE